MPEPKKPTRRTFEAQSESALNGLRLVSHRENQAEGRKTDPSQAENTAHPGDPLTSPEPDVVSKLIDFFKSF